ncbi:hypothetical protein M513_12522 [Trichuris suis]|uniref:Helix-turn-helix domain-containing protein n=1 Tax=Trichuris suis TaxID=68888 RepID=A0A085LNP2_9BILA|nr:hypothetical protein M513_12522 [Trichuris suis]
MRQTVRNKSKDENTAIEETAGLVKLIAWVGKRIRQSNIANGQEEKFLQFSNSIYPNQIVFTMEKETDKTLPFLDALLIRTNEGLKTRVFRKSTHTDLYLNFSSHHPRSVMRGILSGMIDRAIHLCSPEYLPAELRYIRRIFYKNKYPKQFIDQVFRRISFLHAERRYSDDVERVEFCPCKGLYLS